MVFDSLIAMLGADRCRVDPESRKRAMPGWNPEVAHGIGAPPGCLVIPSDIDMVLAVVERCAREGWTLGAVGGRTGIDPHRPVDVALDMTPVRTFDIDPIGMRAKVGAGWTLDSLEETLAEHGLAHGHRLGSGKLATIGGAIATDAAGGFHGRYGRVRDAVLGATVVSSAGRIEHRGAEPGWRGDALLLQVDLLLHPEPEARAWAVVDFPDPSNAVDALRLILRCDARPALAGVFERGRLTLAFEGDEIVQEASYRLGVGVALRCGGKLVGGTDEGEAWWETRCRSDVWAANRRESTWADLIEVNVPWSRIDRVANALSSASDAMSFPEITQPWAGGATVAMPLVATTDAAGWRRLRARLRAIVVAAGGVPRRGFD
ncbi:MAG: FAD-binding oxidoreductase [Armatimonadota bacterium]